MASADRKMKRKQKKEREKDMQADLDLFEKLGDECEACQKPYDKKDREMVSTWSVVVRKEEQIVRLYCPQCWQFAMDLIEKAEEESNE